MDFAPENIALEFLQHFTELMVVRKPETGNHKQLASCAQLAYHMRDGLHLQASFAKAQVDETYMVAMIRIRLPPHTKLALRGLERKGEYFTTFAELIQTLDSLDQDFAHNDAKRAAKPTDGRPSKTAKPNPPPSGGRGGRHSNGAPHGGRTGGGRGDHGAIPTCHYCGAKGHKSPDCNKKKADLARAAKAGKAPANSNQDIRPRLNTVIAEMAEMKAKLAAYENKK